jgi:hypothetical protein
MTRSNPNMKEVSCVHLVEEFTDPPTRVSVSGMKIDRLEKTEGKTR